MSLLVPIALLRQVPPSAEDSAGLDSGVVAGAAGLAALAVSAAAIPQRRRHRGPAGARRPRAGIPRRRPTGRRSSVAAPWPRPVEVIMRVSVADGRDDGGCIVPLFSQASAGWRRVVAGFLGAALSVGWTLGEIASASVTNIRATVRLVAAAPLVMATGLMLAAFSQTDGATVGYVAVWAVAWRSPAPASASPGTHLSAWAMGSVVDDPAEQAVAAAPSTRCS